MQVTRKGFIASVSTAIAAAVALPQASALADVLPRSVKGDPTKFSSHVGSSFQLSRADGTREVVVLRDVLKAKSHPRTEQFSLVFTSPNGAPLAEGTYKMRHTEMGSLDLFLIPGTKQPTLRADFNLLKA